MKVLDGQYLEDLKAEAKRVINLMKSELAEVEDENTKLIMEIVLGATECALFPLAEGNTYDERVIMDGGEVIMTVTGTYPCIVYDYNAERDDEDLLLIMGVEEMDEFLSGKYPKECLYR